MRMSVKQLRAFLAVAHTLNFAHASERLNLSQPALSLTIKGLEEALGGALLQRSTRKVTLTQEGELFLPMARQLLADWDNVEEAMRQSFTLQRGKISVAAMPSFAANVLPEALKAFRDRYAGVNVTVHDVINEQVIEMVREGRVEMGIAFEPSPNHNLLFTPLAVDRFVAIVPQQSPLAKKKQLTWQELLTLDFITLQRPSAVRLMLEEALARSGVGALDLIDDDKVCLTNLNRQIIATRSTVGQYKVDVAAQRIHDIDPDIRVTTHRCFFGPETQDQFDFTQYDYVVDAIDTVTGKLALVMKCKEAGTPIICSMGAGNKMDPTRFEVTDIYKTSVCPLAKVMRTECRKRKIKHLKVVYSKEPAMTPIEDDDISCKYHCICPPGEKHKCTERRDIPGSVAFVPSVVGLIIAGEVIKDLTVEERAIYFN